MMLMKMFLLMNLEDNSNFLTFYNFLIGMTFKLKLKVDLDSLGLRKLSLPLINHLLIHIKIKLEKI